MVEIVITEKSSQARDVHAAVGNRYGVILPAEGHLFDLQEPEDVRPEWKQWTAVLLRPDGLYGTRPAVGGNKEAKRKAIQNALRTANRVWLATDCDREGQLIGQEILEHFKYRGEVMRVMFTAQDPRSILDAFAHAKPNREYIRLYEAAVARRQVDQIYNLSLTRTATVILAAGSRSVIGVGRVKAPTLAIVCRRELEIRSFVPATYHEIVAKAVIASGDLQMRHAPKGRIATWQAAAAIAAAAEGFKGPLGVKVEDKRQAPPPLHDLPSLQKACGSRYGWSAARTLEVAQELYDGAGKKIITYPRAETRYLPESLIGDVPRIVAALKTERSFAAVPVPQPPLIRQGTAGPFSDRGLAGASHHAVIPNANTVTQLSGIWPLLSDDEKCLFGIVARSYLAAVMPDFRYRQTNVVLDVAGREFRAMGRQPIELGWRAAFPEWRPKEERGEDAELLPAMRDGEVARLCDAAVEAKETRPPPRYNEGTLIGAMQDAWRFVADDVLRERLKEAKGIGTPATRGEIISGLKKQEFLVIDGKNIVPTERGLMLHGVLERADPALVDPGVTAQMEQLLDEVQTGRRNMMSVIDAVCDQGSRIIGQLIAHGKSVVIPASLATGTAPKKSRRAPSASRSYPKPSKGSSGRKRRAPALGTAALKPAVPRAPTRLRRSAPSPSAATAAAAAGRTQAMLEEPSPNSAGPQANPSGGQAVRSTANSAGNAAVGETPLRIPFGNKEAAMALGARYRTGGWYAPANVPLAAFKERGWL